MSTTAPVRPRRLEFPRFDRASLAEHLGTDRDAVLRRIEIMTKLLENSFVIPGINRPIGLDGIIGLVPVAGDIVSTALASWLVFEARLLGLPKWKLARMWLNVGIDFVAGLVPFAGDAFDVLFRANTRNLRIIHRHLAKTDPSRATLTRR